MHQGQKTREREREREREMAVMDFSFDSKHNCARHNLIKPKSIVVLALKSELEFLSGVFATGWVARRVGPLAVPPGVD